MRTAYLQISYNPSIVSKKKKKELNYKCGLYYNEESVHFESGIKCDFKNHLHISRGQEAKEMSRIVSNITVTNTSLFQSDITRFTSFLSVVCVLHQRNALS